MSSGRLALRRRWRRLRRWLPVLQREVRSQELSQIGACALIGILVGGIVEVIRRTVEALHRLDFRLPEDSQLSAGLHVDILRVALVPALAGLALGAFGYVARRLSNPNIVDPIEANALFGGRMSLGDSARLLFATIISNAGGASLGMEAGYTQIGASVFSKFGQVFRLRREDWRIFVTAGSAAAIAAAFNAPLAGAFYGFELVLGSYTPRALAPVAAAALSATLTQSSLGSPQLLFAVDAAQNSTAIEYVLFGVLGLMSAGLSIVAMRSVGIAERAFRKLPIPEWTRPAAGGAALSALALVCPQVLGGGHGAIQFHFDHRWTFLALTTLVLAKLAASAISIGSGFRGGLFSSSLFLGCAFGGLFAQTIVALVPSLNVAYPAFLMVGMGSVAAGIVGAPITMVFLVLETTGDFGMTVAVMVGVVMAATIVRLTFGYSFSTWRFHQRGLPIRGAHDIGWLADLTVARVMRKDPVTIAASMPLRDLRQRVPLGASKQVFVLNSDGGFDGMIDMTAAHDPAYADADLGIIAHDLAHAGNIFLKPNENVRTALNLFEETQREVLPVLDSADTRRIVGYLTEAYAFRRYTQELEKRRSAELGAQNLFSVGQTPR